MTAYTCNNSNLSNNLQAQLARLCDKYEIAHEACNAIADGKMTVGDIDFIAKSRGFSDHDTRLLHQIAVSA